MNYTSTFSFFIFYFLPFNFDAEYYIYKHGQILHISFFFYIFG